MSDVETRARQLFFHEIAQHEMTVVHDDGVYRHIRYSRRDSGFDSFSLVTWPGYLAISGDAGDFTFCRLHDMFEFFGLARGDINPHYWGEKIRGPQNGRDAVREYSPEAFQDTLLDWATGDARHGDVPMYPSLLHEALRREVFTRSHDFEYEARELLAELEDDGFVYETWEWDLRDWDFRYLWCCWAIAWGIKTYREAQAAADPSPSDGKPAVLSA